MDSSLTGVFTKSSLAFTAEEFAAVDYEKQQQRSSQFFLELQQQQQLQQAEQQQQAHQQHQRRPRQSIKSPSSAYSAWARAQAMASVYILTAGGALCLFFPEWLSGAYSIALGLMVYFVEQKPSSNSSNNENGPTPPQTSFTPSSVLKAHSIRSSFYLIASIPCFLRAPNYTGGLCLITSGLTYAVAAFLANRKSKS